MGKSKIIIEPSIKNKIINSCKLKKEEKENFLRFINYLTSKEKEELMKII